MSFQRSTFKNKINQILFDMCNQVDEYIKALTLLISINSYS